MSDLFSALQRKTNLLFVHLAMFFLYFSDIFYFSSSPPYRPRRYIVPNLIPAQQDFIAQRFHPSFHLDFIRHRRISPYRPQQYIVPNLIPVRQDFIAQRFHLNKVKISSKFSLGFHPTLSDFIHRFPTKEGGGARVHSTYAMSLPKPALSYI